MNDISTLTRLAGSVPSRVSGGAHSASPDKAAAHPPGAAYSPAPRSVGDRPSAAADRPEPATSHPEAPNRSQIAEATAKLNQRLFALNTTLQFSIDDQYGEMVVKVVDIESKEVIRQIPPEQALALAKSLSDLETGGESPPLEPRAGGSNGGRAGVEGLLLQTKA
jgi:flagellar protein FlaG